MKRSLDRRLPKHDVASETRTGDGAISFSVDITRDVWGDLGVSLANWNDASEESKNIWNIWPDRWDWSHPEFMMRILDGREVVVGEVTKDPLDIVELTDDVLKRLAKS